MSGTSVLRDSSPADVSADIGMQELSTVSAICEAPTVLGSLDQPSTSLTHIAPTSLSDRTTPYTPCENGLHPMRIEDPFNRDTGSGVGVTKSNPTYHYIAWSIRDLFDDPGWLHDTLPLLACIGIACIITLSTEFINGQIEGVPIKQTFSWSPTWDAFTRRLIIGSFVCSEISSGPIRRMVLYLLHAVVNFLHTIWTSQRA